jgi:hypothetical protein
MDRHRAREFYHRVVNLLAPLFLAAFLCSCTTLPNRWDAYNRRDLYSPEPASDSYATMRSVTPVPTATPEPRPQFR